MKWVRGDVRWKCGCQDVCGFCVDMWLLGSSQFVSVYIGMAFSSSKICVTFEEGIP